jgi:hypothetical protein
MTRAILLFAATLLSMGQAVADPTPTAKDVSDIAFVMPPFWVTTRPAIVKGDLTFRRFSIVVMERDAAAALADPQQKITLDLDVGFPNTMMFLCRTNSKYNDTIVIHIPNGMSISGIERDSWISEIGVSVLADDTGFSLPGEYIKGDLFMDRQQQTEDEIIAITNAQNIMLDVGKMKGRINLLVTANIGTARVDGFLRQALTAGDSPFPKAQQFFSTKEMFDQCAKYKRTGKY